MAENPQPQQPAVPQQFDPSTLSKDAKDKLDKIKKHLDVFKDDILKTFDNYVMGIALLPPPPADQQKKEDKDKIHVLVLVDDSDSQKPNRLDLRDKLDAAFMKSAEKIDKNLFPQAWLLSEIWQSCYDAKYDVLQTVAMAAPVYDKGMLAAIKISEVHKSMILKKFEKYIVSYVLAGSLTQGKATETSDIDVWVVIDDTDVKKMTRAELKDKLRAIIIGMGIEAGDITGIKNKINIQVYILTDFWDSLKEANPVIFTLLRDGVPFYDRGIFMPWKQLLKMGKIKPSPEAIDLFMSSGEQMLTRVETKLKEMGMEDIYYALLTPAQAAIMLYGLPPPTPRETPEVMKEIFIEKENLLEEKHVKTLRDTIQVRKDLEHGSKEKFTGKELDGMLKNAKEFLERIQKLFTQIDEIKQKESVADIYGTIVTIVRDILKLENVEKVSDKDAVKYFETEVVHKGLIPEKYLKELKDLEKAKKSFDSGKLSKSEAEKVRSKSSELIKFLVEYLQRKRGRELERARIRVKHGSKHGEVLMFDDVAFIIHDIDHEEKEVSKAPINKDGSLGTPKRTTLEEMEEYLAKAKIPQRTFIKEPIFEDLKSIFGKDVEIQLSQ